MSRCEYSRGNTGVRMGGNLAPKCRTFLLVPTADISILFGIICLDMSIPEGILMFVRGKPSAKVSDFFISPSRGYQCSGGSNELRLSRCEYAQGNTDVRMRVKPSAEVSDIFSSPYS